MKENLFWRIDQIGRTFYSKEIIKQNWGDEWKIRQFWEDLEREIWDLKFSNWGPQGGESGLQIRDFGAENRQKGANREDWGACWAESCLFEKGCKDYA